MPIDFAYIDNMVIGIIDSGIGGLTTTAEIIRVRGGGEYIYYLDNSHHPYGIKTAQQITMYMFTACDKLLGAGAEAIVIACNTATAACIDVLRATYKDIPFIGIEPSIKTATDCGGNICVLATPLTLKQDRFSRLLTGGNFYMPDCSGLADAIELDYPSLTRASKILDKALIRYGNIHFDCAVLGCTHYSIMKNWLTKRLNCKCVDGNTGVARQTRRLCGEETLPPKIALAVTAKSAEARYLEICRSITQCPVSPITL